MFIGGLIMEKITIILNRVQCERPFTLHAV